MNQRALRQLYGYYRQAYRNQLNRTANHDTYDYIENLRAFIIMDYGSEQLFNNLVAMLEPVAWLIEYNVLQRNEQERYIYSEIAEFNRGLYRMFCNCDDSFFGYSCPIHDRPIPF